MRMPFTIFNRWVHSDPFKEPLLEQTGMSCIPLPWAVASVVGIFGLWGIGEKLPHCWMKNTIVRELVQTLKNPPTPVGLPSQFYFRAKPLAKSKSKIQKSKILPKVRIWDSGWADFGFGRSSGCTTRQFGGGCSRGQKPLTAILEGFWGWWPQAPAAV